MPDNWGYVAAAYGVAALLLGLYWRHLVRREAELRRHRRATTGSSRAVAPPRAGHARPEPGARGSRP